jgi:hypothetical protein
MYERNNLKFLTKLTQSTAWNYNRFNACRQSQVFKVTHLLGEQLQYLN